MTITYADSLDHGDALRLQANFVENAEFTGALSLVLETPKRPVFMDFKPGTMRSLVEQISARTAHLPSNAVLGFAGRSVLSCHFRHAGAKEEFIGALKETSLAPDPQSFVVQVTGKSEYWHQAAQQIALMQNAQNLAQGLAPIQRTVINHDRGVVNYAFPDDASLQVFCKQIRRGSIDVLAKHIELEKAGVRLEQHV